MMLGADGRQLVGPRLATVLLQPYVLRLDRRGEVVKRVERGDVVKRCGDRKRVVAVGRFWGERAGEVHHAVHVRLVRRVVAGIIAAGTVAMRLEDLLGQWDASENLRRRYGTIVG